MAHGINKDSSILFVGDIVIFLVSLGLALSLRYGIIPDFELLRSHLAFIFVFGVWLLIFFIFDLYGKHTAAFRRKIAALVIRAHSLNLVFAAMFFYFIPSSGITPRANLFITWFISLVLLLAWRIFGLDTIASGRTEKAFLFGGSVEAEELRHEINANSKYGLSLVDHVKISEIEDRGVTTIILDTLHEKTQAHFALFTRLVGRGVRFIDVHTFYEAVFDKVPLSRVDESWFLTNVSGRSKPIYDALKRVMDLAISIPLFIISLAAYPFIASAIILEDGGRIFIKQDRVGKNGVNIRIIKFRSMTGDDRGDYLRGKTLLRETRIGRVLRRLRADELPQLWNVIRGDLSLVGPRPELPALADVYGREIPYYDVRHMITPGLSGWAQIYHEEHPHHGTDVERTRSKLAYDLYYIKNRSFMLDFKIALKTLKVLLSFAGR